MKRFVHDRSTVDMLHEFETKLDELKTTDVESSTNFDDDEEESLWELEDRKDVYDTDGFLTDYTLWHNILTDEWVTIFGDRELYTPETTYFDMEFGTNEDEARDWFADYSTDFEDSEDDTYFD